MNVHYRLAAVFTAVVDCSEAFGDAFDLSHFCDSLCDLCRIESTLRVRSQLIDVVEMLLGHNENMNRCYGIDVVEAKDIIILIHFV